MRTPLVAAAALLLAGCAGGPKPTPEPIVVVKEVKVPVMMSCIPAKLGGEPDYVDTDEKLRAAAGPEDLLQMLYAGRKQRISRAGEVEPVIKICRKAPAQ